MSMSSARDPVGSQRHTALAFLLAPGIAALAGGLGVSVVCLCARKVEWGLVFTVPIFSGFFFALVGYPTAAILGVPVYLVLPEVARRAFAVVVPLAGAIAAAPWIMVAAPWRDRRSDLTMVDIAFALGCVGGVVFLYLRRPRAVAILPAALPDGRNIVEAP